MQQGKPAYSHVVTVTGPAKMIYIAGQLARDADGNIVGPGDMRAQLEQTFKNLDACLKAAGASSQWAVRPARRSRSAASLSPWQWSRSR
jgi:enamine deaminase RidA (YjgF/YER057c/UK114 family)